MNSLNNNDQSNFVEQRIEPLLGEKNKQVTGKDEGELKTNQLVGGLFDGLIKARSEPPIADSTAYDTLKDSIKSNESIFYYDDEFGKHSEQNLGSLTSGGNKRAVGISGNRVLILPNMDEDSSEAIANRWQRIVKEEVEMAKILAKIGLLSPQAEEVRVKLSDSSMIEIPAFIGESFKSLAENKNIFVIDTNNISSSTWKSGINRLFNSKEDRLKEENWDKVVDPFLADMVKIIKYQIPAYGDALNIAVIKKNDESTVDKYQLRYFGFDFSSKRGLVPVPKTESLDPKQVEERVKRTISKVMDTVCLLEFGTVAYFNQSTKDFRDTLIERFIEKAFARLSEEK